jgi:hypothetical protein
LYAIERRRRLRLEGGGTLAREVELGKLDMAGGIGVHDKSCCSASEAWRSTSARTTAAGSSLDAKPMLSAFLCSFLFHLRILGGWAAQRGAGIEAVAHALVQ